PEAMAREIAASVNALIAPTLNYGITPAMKAFPGAVSISPEAYRPFVVDILENLADNGFRNIIILNGHGGNTAVLKDVTAPVANGKKVRILVINWWSLADDITKEVFGENGGHAGNNETAYIQAVYPEHIHTERYSEEMASVNPPPGAFFTVPVTSSIGLYEKGQGYPTFRKDQAEEYFQKVNEKVAALIQDVLQKWDLAGVYR
ncbi:MAG: creatininase family protein, partial [Acidobacteria bacterium]|nr:creatininase family protein [Acidobacteriota bacterium]